MKLLLLAAAMMGTVTYGTTDLFHKAQDVTAGVTAVYEAAGNIDHNAHAVTRIAQQDKLFEAADNLAPLAEELAHDLMQESFEVAQADYEAAYSALDAYRSR